jgi:competence protein ComEA
MRKGIIAIAICMALAATGFVFAAETIDINSASQQELTQIKSIGPGIAKRVIDYREANGRFKTIDDLIKVKGIGKKKLAGIKSDSRVVCVIQEPKKKD